MGYKSIHRNPNRNTKGFKQNPSNRYSELLKDPNFRAKNRIKRKVQNLLLSNRPELRISKKSIVRETRRCYYVKLGSAEMMYLHLMKLTMSKNHSTALRALIYTKNLMLGKPKRTIEIDYYDNNPIEINLGCSDCPKLNKKET